MRRLFLPGADLRAETHSIDGADAHHLLHVLRVRVGDALILLDNAGNAAHAEILRSEKRSLTVRLLQPAEVAPEPPLHVTVAQALGKGDKFEQVVQHATEVGASAFLPLLTERAAVRLDAKTALEKQARWNLIAKGAAEQAGRARIPFVHPMAPFPELTRRFGEYRTVMLLHPEGEVLGIGYWVLGIKSDGVIPNPLVETTSFWTDPNTQYPIPNTLLLVGPEGGFAPEEVEAARAAGAQIVSLGPYTLRTETAALVAVSQILMGVGDRGSGVEDGFSTPDPRPPTPAPKEPK